MTVKEIFSALAAHMAHGLIFHNELSTIFGFLNLLGYQKLQEYRYFDETYNYRDLQDFYLDHYNKMIEPQTEEIKNIIPSRWYNYTKMEVDVGTKRSAIKDVMKEWINWEESTCTLLKQSYTNLLEQGEIFAALKIADYLKDTTNELQEAREKYINLESIGYDMVSIVEEQEELCKVYKKKIKHIYNEDDVK